MSGVPFGIKNPSKTNPKETTTNEFYENILSENVQYSITKYIFDDEQFIQFFDEYKNKSAFKRAMRITVQIGTIEAVLRGKYFKKEKSILLDKKKMLQNANLTKFYSSDYKFISISGKEQTKIFVVRGDSLECALHRKRDKLNPITLIMASSSHPGGAYRKGAGAQEEVMFYV